MSSVSPAKMLGMFGLVLIATVLSAQAEDEPGETVKIETVLDVTCEIESSKPPTLIVTAVGEVPTGGYTNALLSRRLYTVPPKDGIQDFTFTAIKPSGIVPQVISKVTAKDTWKNYTEDVPWIKGIRVHGVDQGVKVIMLGEPKK